MRHWILMTLSAFLLSVLSHVAYGGNAMVLVTVENIAPEGGVALTPLWVGFHNGNFDSYNGGLRALEGLERVAEDGDTSVISRQFLDFSDESGGYTYVDNSRKRPKSRLVRTGDLDDLFRQDATIGGAPLLPGQSAQEVFDLNDDGSNDFLSYVAMVLPTNDFFVANGDPMAHDIGELLRGGGEISFFIGTPEGGVNDAGTERETFKSSAGNPLFPGRNLPPGQAGPDEGQKQNKKIANVNGDAFSVFFPRSERKRNRRARRRYPNGQVPDVEGFDFNQYENGIARVTVSVVPDPIDD